MKIPTVGNCCGCIDLITAGKVIGWLGVVNGVIQFTRVSQNIIYLFQALLSLAISGSWLYGIEKTLPSYLLVNLILSAIGIVGLFGLDILLIHALARLGGNSDSGSILGLMLSIYICSTFLCIYLWIVMYSVYEAVKKLSEQPKTQTARHDVTGDTSKVMV